MGKDLKLSFGRVLVGDCLVRLADLDDASIDSVVTDPPYELGFIRWDASGIAYQMKLWEECLRVLKPGGHLLAFGGTRTYHRMACAIEDAGFEIRDSIHWIYGCGFPKSLDVSKAIDKQRDDRNDIYKVTAWIRATRDAAGISNRDINDAFGFHNMAGHWTSSKSQPTVPTLEQVPQLLDVLGLTVDEVPDDIRKLLWDLNGKKGQPGPNWAKREVVGTKMSGIVNPDEGPRHTIGASKAVEVDVTVAATDEARRWEGWGTGLKPAHEPIVMARKPLDGTVAGNVLEHGTGGLNIDGCRVGGQDGRWPANIMLDSAAADALNQQNEGAARYFTQADYEEANMVPFIYQAKPSKAERNAGLKKKVLTGRDPGEDAYNALHPGSRHEALRKVTPNTHPTVKPVALMRHLVRLVTPPGGTVLDPFLGSGTTAVAATLEGFRWVCCEMNDDYLPIIQGRVAWAEAEVKAGRANKPQYKNPASKKPKPAQPTLEDQQQQ